MKTSFVIPNVGQPWPSHIVYDPSGQWAVSKTTINPELAQAMLDLNIKNNRKPKAGSISRFTADMAAGRWRFSHEGIAFNSKGELIDGQHRLISCIATGVTFHSLVFFGFDEVIAVNTGANRDATAAASILGIEANSTDFATIRNFLSGNSYGCCTYSNSELIEKFQIYTPSLRWLRGCMGNGSRVSRIITGPVRGALVRAYYYVDKEKLDRFISVLMLETPATMPGDRSAVNLRNVLSASERSGGSARRETFMKTQRAIDAFSNGEDLKKIYTIESDLFPIPTAEMLANPINTEE